MKEEAARILLVDDSAMDVELMLEAFLQSGSLPSVHTCRSAESALSYLQSRLEAAVAALPSLILLDVKMPGMRGHEALQRIKRDPCLRRIPVVMMTNSKEERDMARCYDLGANGYIVKPVAFEDLVELARVIDRYWLHANVLPPR